MPLDTRSICAMIFKNRAHKLQIKDNIAPQFNRSRRLSWHLIPIFQTASCNYKLRQFSEPCRMHGRILHGTLIKYGYLRRIILTEKSRKDFIIMNYNES